LFLKVVKFYLWCWQLLWWRELTRFRFENRVGGSML